MTDGTLLFTDRQVSSPSSTRWQQEKRSHCHFYTMSVARKWWRCDELRVSGRTRSPSAGRAVNATLPLNHRADSTTCQKRETFQLSCFVNDLRCARRCAMPSPPFHPRKQLLLVEVVKALIRPVRFALTTRKFIDMHPFKSVDSFLLSWIDFEESLLSVGLQSSSTRHFYQRANSSRWSSSTGCPMHRLQTNEPTKSNEHFNRQQFTFISLHSAKSTLFRLGKEQRLKMERSTIRTGRVLLHRRKTNSL